MASNWTREENKRFEDAIAEHLNKETEEEWAAIAAAVGNTKTIQQVKQHYKLLLEDINDIEAGLVPLPEYKDVDAIHGYEVDSDHGSSQGSNTVMTSSSTASLSSISSKGRSKRESKIKSKNKAKHRR